MTAVSATPNADIQNGNRDDRKQRKPLIERKRRERINHCLEQLRETLVGVLGLDQSKLEKADILEMTVKHLQNIQSNRVTSERQTASVPDPEAQQRYSTGYIQCMHEVHNLLLSCDWMDKMLGARLLNHLLRSLPKSSPSKPLLTSLWICEVDDDLSPPSVALPTQTNDHDLLIRPPPTKSPQLTALEMWRPW